MKIVESKECTRNNLAELLTTNISRESRSKFDRVLSWSTAGRRKRRARNVARGDMSKDLDSYVCMLSCVLIVRSNCRILKSCKSNSCASEVTFSPVSFCIFNAIIPIPNTMNTETRHKRIVYTRQ